MVMTLGKSPGLSLYTGGIGRGLLRALIAYWPLDEASGSRRDLSGNGLTLTDNNTVTGNPGPSGKLPLASQFTAINSEFLSIVDSASISVADIDFTFVGWVYLDSQITAPTMLSKWTSVADQREYIIEFGSAAQGSVGLSLSQDGISSDTASTGNISLTTGVWYFVAAWHDSLVNTLNIQVNNGAVYPAAHTTGGFDGTTAFRIGRWTDNNMDGRVAGVGFWKRLLTAGERSYLYGAGSGRLFVAGRGFI